MSQLQTDKKNQFTQGKTIAPGGVEPGMMIWFKYKSVDKNYKVSSYNPCLWVLEIDKQNKIIAGVNMNYLDNGTFKIINELEEGLGYKRMGLQIKVQGGTWSKITSKNAYRNYKMNKMSGIKLLELKEG